MRGDDDDDNVIVQVETMSDRCVPNGGNDDDGQGCLKALDDIEEQAPSRSLRHRVVMASSLAQDAIKRRRRGWRTDDFTTSVAWLSQWGKTTTGTAHP